MSDFWRQAVCNDLNQVSSSRIVNLVAGVTLSVSTLVLTFGSFWVPAMLSTLTAFGPSLAGLAAGNYMMQRWTDGKTEKTDA